MFVEILNPDNYRRISFALPTLLTASAMLALGLIAFSSAIATRASAISFFVMTLTGGHLAVELSMVYCALDERVATGLEPDRPRRHPIYSPGGLSLYSYGVGKLSVPQDAGSGS